MKRLALRGMAARVGSFAVLLVGVGAIAAPVLSPHAPDARFSRLLNAPPTAIHVVDPAGAWHAPFIYPWRVVSRLEQRYEPDTSAPVPLHWFTAGHLVTSSDDARAPLLWLGADSFGRDVFSRLIFGARVSLGVALLAACGALVLGVLVGGSAGYAGGWLDDAVTSGTEVVLVLPAMYVVLGLRSVLPLVLDTAQVATLMVAIFAVLGSPVIAKGVRGLVRSEGALDYVTAARSLGASPRRILIRHLLPSTRGFLIVQFALLVPSFVVAEATLSYVGMGFPTDVASWGTMLQEASSIHALSDFPWLLSPAVAMFVLLLGVNLLTQGGERAGGAAVRSALLLMERRSTINR